MKKTFVKQITCTILIYIKMIYAQVSQLDFRQVQMPNNMLRITQEKTAGISSQIECAAWCLVNSASKDNCTAYHYQEEQDQRCECGDPYCYDDIKELDTSEIKAHVDVKCKRPLLPTPPDGYTVGIHGGKAYKRIDAPPLNHADANLVCEADNANLAMSKTDGDALDMMELLGTVHSIKYWVGLTTIVGSSDLNDVHFIDGSPYEPNAVNLILSILHPDSACLFMYIYSGNFNHYQSTSNEACTNEHAYICQWDPCS